MARCGRCGHFASVHHAGGGGRPGGSSCGAPDCDCPKFVEGTDAGVPLGKDNLTPTEVAQLIGLSGSRPAAHAVPKPFLGQPRGAAAHSSGRQATCVAAVQQHQAKLLPR